MSILAVSGIATVAVTVAVGAPLLHRQRAYRRLVNYNPQQDCVASFDPTAVETVPIRCEPADGFVLPKLSSGSTSVLLELNVRANGVIRDPVLEISVGDFRDRQVLERGVQGVRFLNLTRLFRSGVRPGEKIHLSGSRLTWKTEARLHVSRECVQPGERMLVVAPHPDDAEIAAFGLYSDTDANVVTLTAGDASDRYTGKEGMSAHLERGKIARVRVWDSLTVPQLGGIALENVLNLAYPDGRLREMQAAPDSDFRGQSEEELDFCGLRRMNRSPSLRADACCSWNSLVADLCHVLKVVKPTVIATPHPWLDPHPDHQLTTLAVCDALRSAVDVNGRFYFYTCHNRRSELWPFGPAGSGVAMLPIFADDLVECDGFYSHILTPDRQQAKFLALEAMHDVRDIGAPEPRTTRVHLRRARAELTAALHGTGHPSTSYLRRAVRPDELFLTTPFAKGRELCARVARKLHYGSP